MDSINFIKWTFLVLFSFLIAACTAMKPVHVLLDYEATEHRAKVEIVEDEMVKFSIAKLDIFDDRADKTSLGSTDAAIYGNGVLQWVQSGIVSLSELGYSFSSPAYGEKPSKLSLQVNIKRTSCRGTVMHMRCTVLIDVSFFDEGVIVQRKSYYGSQLKDKGLLSEGHRHFNKGAIIDSFNRALDDLLNKFEPDLRSFCMERS